MVTITSVNRFETSCSTIADSTCGCCSRRKQSTPPRHCGSSDVLQQRHQQAVAAVQKAVQQADVIFYSVNPGGPSIKLNQIAMRAERGMEAIAETTGGTAFVPDSDADLERVFRQVAAELRGQYLLQYYGDSEAPAGQFRKIQVAVPARNDVRVRARQGYYPKKQQTRSLPISDCRLPIWSL